MEATAVRRVTAREFFELPEDGRRLELVRGDVVEMPDGGYRHGFVGQNLHFPLANFVRESKRGVVPLPGTGFELAEDLVRKPDTAYIAPERAPAKVIDGWIPGAPTLAVEIVPPNDKWSEVEAKAREYIDAGTEEVWLVSPFSRTVHVWRTDSRVRVLGAGDVLETPLLPGFSLEVARIFEGA